MTVKELIAKLESFPPDNQIGIDDHGHFYVFAGVVSDEQPVLKDGHVPAYERVQVARLY